MKAGVGYANDSDALDAGRRAAADAMRQGGVAAPDLVLAFCAGTLDARAFYAGVRAAVGTRAPILGGSAIGVITNEHLSYEGSPAAVAVLDLGEPLRGLASVDGLDRDEREAGRRLGLGLGETGVEGAASLLLFYDSVRLPATASTPPVLNASRPLLAGLAEGLPAPLPVVGAGVLGDYAFAPTWQFCGDGARRQNAVGALLRSSARPSVQVMHGCTPMDGVPHVLTRVDADVIHEIDGRPAAEVIDEVLGSREWRAERPLNRLALGVPQGERQRVAGEDGDVTRLVTGVLPDGKAIGVFEPDLQQGAEVLFMLRDPTLMSESARAGSEAALERMRREGGRPAFALYIDGAARAAVVSRTPDEEAAAVQAVMAREGVPLLGFYSGVALAPVRGVSRGLDWTGVLLLLGDG